MFINDFNSYAELGLPVCSRDNCRFSGLTRKGSVFVM